MCGCVCVSIVCVLRNHSFYFSGIDSPNLVELLGPSIHVLWINNCCLLASKIAVNLSLSQPAVHKNTLLLTFLPAIDRIVLFNFCQSDGCKMVSYCYFNLDFWDSQWIEDILCHLHMPFYELYFVIICSVYCDVVSWSIYNFYLHSRGIIYHFNYKHFHGSLLYLF